MAVYSQVSENKRGRNEYWNDVLVLPDAKRRTISRTLEYDSDLTSLLDKLDDMGSNDCNQEGTDFVNVNVLDGEIGFNAVIKEIRLKVNGSNNNIDSTNVKDSNDQMGSVKEEELTEWNSEWTSSVCNIGDFKIYDDIGSDLGFVADHIFPHEFGIIINYIDVDSMTNFMYYSDAVYGFDEATEDLYGFLWDYDIWQFNEQPVIQNDFATVQQEEFGIWSAWS